MTVPILRRSPPPKAACQIALLKSKASPGSETNENAGTSSGRIPQCGGEVALPAAIRSIPEEFLKLGVQRVSMGAGNDSQRAIRRVELVEVYHELAARYSQVPVSGCHPVSST